MLYIRSSGRTCSIVCAGIKGWARHVGLSFRLNTVEEEERIKLKVSRRQEIIKIRADINGMENRNTTKKISGTKNWFFEEIDKIDKPLDGAIKRKQRRHLPISRMRTLTSPVSMDMKRIIKKWK